MVGCHCHPRTLPPMIPHFLQLPAPKEPPNGANTALGRYAKRAIVCALGLSDLLTSSTPVSPLSEPGGLCKKKEAPQQPHDVPGPLQQLPKQVIEALRPLDIDTGVYERVPQGYRVHSSMIRFAWSAEDVETKISKLRQESPQEAREEGLSASD